MYSRSDWNADATSNPLFYDMHDALTCPLSRDCGRRATSRNDNFTYNTRSELTQAELGTNHYAYSYDNIGNRKTAQELAEESTYEANQLNQYSTITQSETAFTPTFDADGNQTLIKTSTGIWTVAYNADNRPISFTQAHDNQNTIIECGYDYMGRRYTKKVTSNGTVSLHQRYIYRGYLQIACVDLTQSGHPALWYITWDPTEPVATRPLAIQKNATWYSYSHDLTKNVTELYQSDGLIATSYDYSPYGAATAEGIDQALQWSSEYHDPELALTYYNYRHYNPQDGRWINRDPIGEGGGFNLYGFVKNKPIWGADYLGQKECNEDTYMHFQDFYFTVTLHTLLDSDIKISDPQTVIADSIKDFLGEAAVLGAADKADVVKDLKKIRKKTPKENLFRLFAEGLSSAGGYLDSITIELTAQYCCYSCENGEEKYQWKPAAGTVYMSGILADIKHPKGLEEASNKLIHSMVAAAESLKNNACRED